MKEVTRTIYEADDGTIFDNADACEKHESEIAERLKNTTHWLVIHSPDLTEGRGWYGRTVVECYIAGYAPVEAMVRDWCHRTFGRPMAFVQGCSPMENWTLRQLDREQAKGKHDGRVGDYSYPAKRVSLVVGPRDTGLTEKPTTPPEAPGHGE